MRTAVRGIAACAVALMILAAASSAAPSLAQAPAKSLKDGLVGHWQLVSVTSKDGAPYGSSPQGSMFLDAGGHFSVIVITSGRARSIAYFGTYTVDEPAKTMTMHIENSAGGSGVSAAGRDETRLVTLNGDQLVVQAQTPKGPGGFNLTWKRAD